ncbi:kinase-like domain-containing protein [Glomus cerebriforme]|uniref:Kinase-like domain-containing protein n=1 Tax=Glomus cerebriforme TaxID=658196 RepID=A0A397SKB2_9GLOM|nr:kinase-like domain-containing protein [Glomus cerebriforme]
MVLEYANGGKFNDYIVPIYYWKEKLQAILHAIMGLKTIHKNKMVHRDFYIGNILLLRKYCSLYYKHSKYPYSKMYISDMGLCGEADNVDKTKIYLIMPYVAPEVLCGKPYTQAADILGIGIDSKKNQN